MTYLQKRYMSFVAIAAVAIALPFVRIDGNHLMLLSFDKKQLHILGILFDTQELYLMPFIIMFLFVGVFFLTSFAGRVWCGWACPQTMFRVVYRDLIQTYLLRLRNKTSNKQKDIDFSSTSNKAKYVLSIVLYSIFAVLAASNFLWYFVPPEDFFAYLQNPNEHGVLVGFLFFMTLFLIVDIVWFQERFCVYVCPYGRVQSILYDNNTLTAVYDTNRGGNIYENGEKVVFSKKQFLEGEECIACEKCVKVCPTHIDIRKGLQIECIECLGCVDACTEVMGKLGKPSLIDWTSDFATTTKQKTKLLRPKIIGYLVALAVILAILSYMTSKKEFMLLNINRTSQLYSLQGEYVQNGYMFLFQNNTSKDHKYYFEITNPNITIHRPKEAISIDAGKKLRKIVVLQTPQDKVSQLGESSPVAIKIKAYSIDTPEIHIERESIFAFPR